MSNNQPQNQPPICDYEGSKYQTDFWVGQGRDYEDAVERIALGHQLPKSGRRLLEIGAGFGRLVDLYANYDEVILLDYAVSQLRQAQKRLGNDRFTYVAGNIYSLPFADCALDTVVTVRMLHHVQDLALAFKQINRVLGPDGVYVLEFANKRHLKAIGRYWLNRQTHNPFDWEPLEFVALNFDFHPDYVAFHLAETGFQVQAERAVSTFRSPAIKRIISPHILANIDGWLQSATGRLKLSPSIFLQTTVEKAGNNCESATLWQCPKCAGAELEQSSAALACHQCHTIWSIEDGIYNFRT